MPPLSISFISANYVARARGYDGTTDWGTHDRATIEHANIEHFTAVARDVAAAGFEAIDIWTGHCHWLHHAAGDYREQVKGACSNYDLAITSYAGGLNPKSADEIEAPFKFMKQLGAPIFAGGLWGMPADQVMPTANAVCQRLGVKWAFENHPEKSADEILTKIGGGKFEHIGVAFDTGWCGTQGMDGVAAAQALRGKLMLLHLKDVVAAGAHDTCALGDGIVGCEQILKSLLDAGWSGPICIEHEPFDRDPMPEVKKSLDRVKKWIGR